MEKVHVYNSKGEVVKDLDLNKSMFDVEVNTGLVHQVLVAQQANRRHVLAHTKDRSEVRGGGRKPWKQKGTGRARHGSSRSPIWSGGGVTFGPTKFRNFSKQINKKMKRKALYMVLSDKVADKNFVIIESLNVEGFKTKNMKSLFVNLPVEKKILLVVPTNDARIWKSAANLDKITVINADSLNVEDVLNAGSLVLPEQSLGIIESTFTNNKK